MTSPWLDGHAEEGQSDGGVRLCAVCGDEADSECAACDRPLCDEHRRTTSVPGDSFCQIGEGCTTPQAAVAEMDAAWEALKAHPVAGPFIAGFRIPSVDEEP